MKDKENTNQPEFLDRIQNPENYPYITNEDGSISTHKMSAEVDEKGNWYVYPNIVRTPTGELYEFKDTRQAMEYNIKNNNYLPMKSKAEAIKYAIGGYKDKTKLKTFNPLQNNVRKGK